MDVFDVFSEAIIPCTFLELNQGGVLGNTVASEHEFGGILKERKGMSTNQNMELKESTSTLHIRPDEPFIAEVGKLVGHGMKITKNGMTETYRIVGQNDGYDFDEGETDFFYVTLKAESLADYGVEG